MQRSAELTAPIGESVPHREAYPIPEVAVLLGGASERWVWALVERGELPSFKAGGRRLVRRADLLAYIDRLSADEQRARAAVTSSTRHEFGASA